MVQYSKFIFQIPHRVSRPFYINYSRTKKVSFSLNSSNDTLIVFLHVRTATMARSNFLDGCKHTVGKGSEAAKTTHILLKHKY